MIKQASNHQQQRVSSMLKETEIQPRRAGYVRLWLLAFWIAASNCCWAQAPADIQNVFLPAPRDLRQLLTRARKSLDQQEYADAVMQLGTLLTSKKPADAAESSPENQDFFIPIAGNTEKSTSLKTEAQRLLGSMPKEGRDLYELQFGTDARLLLDTAIKAGDATK